MRNQTKLLLIIVCAVLIVACGIMSTLAFLTDRESVTNTFTVGDVQIEVDESVVTPDGEPEFDGNGNPVREQQGNEYHLVPGKTYPKDPVLTVKAGSEPCYVRMQVTLNCISELKAIFGDDFLPENYIDGWDRNKWLVTSVTDNGDNTVTYEFRYHTTVDVLDAQQDLLLEPLFTHFTVPAELTGEQLLTVSDLEIHVVGNAIQAESFASADAAWAAFENQYLNP